MSSFVTWRESFRSTWRATAGSFPLLLFCGGWYHRISLQGNSSLMGSPACTNLIFALEWNLGRLQLSALERSQGSCLPYELLWESWGPWRWCLVLRVQLGRHVSECVGASWSQSCTFALIHPWHAQSYSQSSSPSYGSSSKGLSI